MSAEDARMFFTRLETDEELQDRARAVQSGPEAECVSGLIALAAELGLKVTPEDLAAAPPAAARPDDEALRPVVGGFGCDIPGNTEVYTVPLG